jgi:hypothetical protein
MAITQDNDGRAITASIVLYAKTNEKDPEELTVSDYEEYQKWADQHDLGLRANYATTFEDMLKWTEKITDEDVGEYKEFEGLRTVEPVIDKQNEEYRYPGVPAEQTQPEVAEALERWREEVDDDVKENTPLLYWLLGTGTPPYKMEKGDADYDTKPHGEMRCGNCEYYYEGMDGSGVCSQVRGNIQRSHWCRLWEEAELDLDDLPVDHPEAPEVKSVEKAEDTDEDPVGMAFVHRHEAGADLFLKQDDGEGGWVPYEGEQGGTGWENTETGDVRYTDEPPGPTAEFVEDGQVLEGVTDLGELSPGDDIQVGDEIYEVQAVQEGPTGDMFTRVEFEGQEFTVKQDDVRAQVLGEALETGDYDVERGTYEGELAESLVKGQLNEKGSDGFQNVRQLQHNLSDVENEKLLLDVLEEEASNRNSKTAVDRIKGRCSAVGIEESRINDSLPGGGIDVDELDNIVMEEVAEGQPVVVTPDTFPGITEPVKGEIHDIVQEKVGSLNGVYIEPEEDLDYLQEGQVVEINGEEYEIDRIYEDENGNPDPSFVDPDDKTPIIDDDYPEFSDFEEEAEIVEDIDNDLLPVSIDSAEEEIYYQDGERPDDPYPAPGYDSAQEELIGTKVFDGYSTKRGIENRDAVERIIEHADTSELKEVVNMAHDGDTASINGRMAGAILYKRGEGGITQAVDFDFDDASSAGADKQEVMQSAEETFEKLDTTTAVGLAAHTSEVSMESYSALGCYKSGSERIVIDQISSWSTTEDTVAHEFGHSMHYLMGVAGDSHRDNTDKSNIEDYKFNVTAEKAFTDDPVAESFQDDFKDFVDDYEERLKKDGKYSTHLRDYQNTNANEVFAVAFGQWIDDPTKLEEKQPELKRIFEEHFGSGDSE